MEAVVQQTPTRQIDSFIRIPLLLDTVPVFSFFGDIYYRQITASSIYLVCNQGRPFSDRVRHHLESLSNIDIFLAFPSDESIAGTPAQVLDKIMVNAEDMPGAIRYQCLISACILMMYSTEEPKDMKVFLKFVQRLVDYLYEMIAEDGLHPNDCQVPDLKKLDLFAHSFVITSYAMLLAHHLGTFNEQEVRQIGVGAFFHDVGKWKTEKSTAFHPEKPIRHKLLHEYKFFSLFFRDTQEKLTAVSYEITCNWQIKRGAPKRAVHFQHAVDGFRLMCRWPFLSWGQLMMIYQHHELNFCHGGPVGLPGTEIHPWAKICTVVDSFSNFYIPDKDDREIRKTLKYLRENCPDSFDEEMVTCWIKLILQGKQ
jgi:HD-GYP domain-containing protein (c-di-GMP phosphodiesterase class II)